TPPSVNSSGARRPGSGRDALQAPPKVDSDVLEVPPDSTDLPVGEIQLLSQTQKGKLPTGKATTPKPPQPAVKVDEFIPSTMHDPASHRSSHDVTQDEDAAAVKAMLAAGNLEESEESEESVDVAEVVL